MPLQNRVTPENDIVAADGRGLFMGNRGRFHTADRVLGKQCWTTQTWVICELVFKGRRREVMAANSYTELFFLDEAVALAAGHRPCGECRREGYRAFRRAWAAATGEADGSVQLIDRKMHKARIDARSRSQLRHKREIADLPDSTFISLPGSIEREGSWLVRGDRLHRYAPERYGEMIARPSAGIVDVLTPAVTVAVLAAGYRPVLHPSLGAPHG